MKKKYKNNTNTNTAKHDWLLAHARFGSLEAGDKSALAVDVGGRRDGGDRHAPSR